MKTLIVLFFVSLLCGSLAGQSHLVKGGASYRNNNYLTNTGNQQIGWQVGYRHIFPNDLALEANLGGVSNYWDVSHGDIDIHTERERNKYLEAIFLVPILRRRVASNNLRGGIAYVGSYNTFSYPETASIINNTIESRNIASLNYFLHELGLVLDYTHPITSQLIVYAGLGLSGSI